MLRAALHQVQRRKVVRAEAREHVRCARQAASAIAPDDATVSVRLGSQVIDLPAPLASGLEYDDDE